MFQARAVKVIVFCIYLLVSDIQVTSCHRHGQVTNIGTGEDADLAQNSQVGEVIKRRKRFVSDAVDVHSRDGDKNFDDYDYYEESYGKPGTVKSPNGDSDVEETEKSRPKASTEETFDFAVNYKTVETPARTHTSQSPAASSRSTLQFVTPVAKNLGDCCHLLRSGWYQEFKRCVGGRCLHANTCEGPEILTHCFFDGQYYSVNATAHIDKQKCFLISCTKADGKDPPSSNVVDFGVGCCEKSEKLHRHGERLRDYTCVHGKWILREPHTSPSTPQNATTHLPPTSAEPQTPTTQNDIKRSSVSSTMKTSEKSTHLSTTHPDQSSHVTETPQHLTQTKMASETPVEAKTIMFTGPTIPSEAHLSHSTAKDRTVDLKEITESLITSGYQTQTHISSESPGTMAVTELAMVTVESSKTSSESQPSTAGSPVSEQPATTASTRGRNLTSEEHFTPPSTESPTVERTTTLRPRASEQTIGLAAESTEHALDASVSYASTHAESATKTPMAQQTAHPTSAKDQSLAPERSSVPASFTGTQAESATHLPASQQSVGTTSSPKLSQATEEFSTPTSLEYTQNTAQHISLGGTSDIETRTATTHTTVPDTDAIKHTSHASTAYTGTPAESTAYESVTRQSPSTDSKHKQVSTEKHSLSPSPESPVVMKTTTVLHGESSEETAEPATGPTVQVPRVSEVHTSRRPETTTQIPISRQSTTMASTHKESLITKEHHVSTVSESPSATETTIGIHPKSSEQTTAPSSFPMEYTSSASVTSAITQTGSTTYPPGSPQTAQAG
ncbi:mucin-3A-like [Pollicipes pollicipes]|uniref:mucin-3A-like n=1 Tax=Pollicipes pollicipes TaxID=41117 RepID=UPI001884CAB4|nr:mucin-3A-like [Pollicipes pollicipes]